MNNTHHIIEIPTTNRTFYVPKELAHCNKQEFIAVANLLWQWTSGIINFEEFKIQAIYKLLNLKPSRKEAKSLENENKHANIYLVAQLLESFFDKKEEKRQIKQNFTHNHVPKVTPIFRTYHGPSNEFNNATFGQYEDGLNLYHLFSLDQDVELLYMLMATFYLPKGATYNSNLTTKRAQKFKHIDFGDVYGFYLFFGAFQLYLTTSKVWWQGKEIDLSIIFSSSGSTFTSDLADLGGKSIVYYIAKLNFFGDVKKVRKTNLWEIMLALYDVRKEHLDEKAQEKQKPNS